MSIDNVIKETERIIRHAESIADENPEKARNLLEVQRSEVDKLITSINNSKS